MKPSMCNTTIAHYTSGNDDSNIPTKHYTTTIYAKQQDDKNPTNHSNIGKNATYILIMHAHTRKQTLPTPRSGITTHTHTQTRMKQQNHKPYLRMITTFFNIENYYVLVSICLLFCYLSSFCLQHHAIYASSFHIFQWTTINTKRFNTFITTRLL